jgi:hypothetical protein
MSTLIELFDQHRAQLIKNLNEDSTPEKVVYESKRFLDWLKVNYLESIPASAIQQRLVPFIIDLLKASLSTLVSACKTEIWHQESAKISPSRYQSFNFKILILRLGQLMAVVLLVLQMWGNSEFLALIVLLALTGSELITLLPLHRRFWSISSNQSQAVSVSNPRQIKIQVDISIYLPKLADALITADKVLAQLLVLNQPSQTSRGLEQYPLLLELLKDLLEANSTGDSAYALKKTKMIPALLEQHALKAEVFNGKNHQLFEFLPNLDPNENHYKTLTPALTKDNRLISSGRVLEPKIGTEKSDYHG